MVKYMIIGDELKVSNMRDGIELQVDEILACIENNSDFSKNKHLIILGNNASGKTRFSKRVLDKAVEKGLNNVYYIGPYNRTLSMIDGQKTFSTFSSFEPLMITQSRLKCKNGEDCFSNFINGLDGPAIAATELNNNFGAYKDLIEKFLNIKLGFEGDSKLGSEEIMIKEETENRSLSTLSSNEMAILRIIMEVKYAELKLCKYILIDEFDSYLDIVTMQSFLAYLVESFELIRFIFVIHNPEALINIVDADVLLIQKSCISDEQAAKLVMRFDVNEIESISELESILNRFSKKDKKDHDQENYLRMCISRYLSNNELLDSDIQQIKEMNISRLSVRERVMYEYVVRLIGI